MVLACSIFVSDVKKVQRTAAYGATVRCYTAKNTKLSVHKYRKHVSQKATCSISPAWGLPSLYTEMLSFFVSTRNNIKLATYYKSDSCSAEKAIKTKCDSSIEIGRW
jgi:hypothetical protein